jgi:prepilin-type N-terminal cleavage/methylation domain-containing protein
LAFSLIELLVVMTVIAILCAAATPGVGRWLEDYQVRAASRQLMSDLQFARMRAVADRVQYQVYFNQAHNQYWIQGWNPGAATWNQTGSTRQLSNAASPAYERGVTLTFATNGDKTVTFSPMGQATGANTASLSSTNYQRNVTVAATGRVQIVQVRP